MEDDWTSTSHKMPASLFVDEFYTAQLLRPELSFFFISLIIKMFRILKVDGSLTHDFSWSSISLEKKWFSSTAPNCLTEILGCLRQFHPAVTTDELKGLCLIPGGPHPTSNTVKCCLTSEILRDQVYPTLHGPSRTMKDSVGLILLVKV